MLVDTQNLVSLTEANQNFSRVARLVDERGSVVILRNNHPKYVVLAYDEVEGISQAPVEYEEPTIDAVLAAGAEFLERYSAAFEELAK